jgi:hypothetical protein
LLAENPILFTKVINHLQLLSVHPRSDGDQHESEGVEDAGHLDSSISRALEALGTNLGEFKQIQFPDDAKCPI